MKRMLGLASVAVLLTTGCHDAQPRLNAPPHGIPSEERTDLQGTFTYMNDNALLADMTVSDYHFMPHRSLLTSLGKSRVERLAQLMEAYGGQIRFNTDSVDEELNRQRSDAIVAYLGELGVPAASQTVKRAGPGGTGMSANEAILIMQKEGTYDPEKPKPSATDTNSVLN